MRPQGTLSLPWPQTVTLENKQEKEKKKKSSGHRQDQLLTHQTENHKRADLINMVKGTAQNTSKGNQLPCTTSQAEYPISA